MADVLTRKQRRLVMSRIRGKDTKPEKMIRSALHKRGLRFRLHSKYLPGRPDLTFRKHHTVLFVHGCFWHRHQCALFKWPATRADFWRDKINGNAERDRKTVDALLKSGWRVLTIWECAFRGADRRPFDEVLDEAEAFICSSQSTRHEITGQPRETCREIASLRSQ